LLHWSLIKGRVSSDGAKSFVSIFTYRTAGGRSISAALREGEESITKVEPLYQMNFVSTR
jgi:hypothetical protein